MSVDGCLLEDNEVLIGIEDVFEFFIISCGIVIVILVEFMWIDVIGVDEYEIIINGVDQGVVFGLFFIVIGFSLNIVVIIMV